MQVQALPLSFPFTCIDPFLFAVYHGTGVDAFEPTTPHTHS